MGGRRGAMSVNARFVLVWGHHAMSGMDLSEGRLGRVCRRFRDFIGLWEGS